MKLYLAQNEIKSDPRFKCQSCEDTGLCQFDYEDEETGVWKVGEIPCLNCKSEETTSRF